MVKKGSKKKQEEVIESEGSVMTQEVQKEAEVDARFRGSEAAVKKAMARYSDESEDQEKEATSIDEGGEKILADLANPSNKVIIKRTFPPEFNGRNCRGEVATLECPLSMDDIREEILLRHGGARYRISVHPNTPNGELRVLSAYTFSNPDTDVPLLHQTREDEDEELWMPPVDPTMIPNNNPSDVLEESYRKRTRVATVKAQAKEAEKALSELEGDDDSPPTEEIFSLRAQLQDMERRREYDQKFTAIQTQMAKGGDSSQLTIAVLQMMQSANQQQAQMRSEMMGQQTAFMQSMMDQNKNKEESSLSSKLNGLMFDLLSDKLFSGSSNNNEDDPLKYAIKELVPAVKEIAGNALNPPQSPQPGVVISPEDSQKAYDLAARKAAEDVTKNLRAVIERKQAEALSAQQQYLKDQETSRLTSVSSSSLPPISGNARSGEGGLEAAPQPPVENLSPSERSNMNVPPTPDEEGYDRSVAVNFVLDSLITDIKNKCPRESYIIDDFLLQLDEELLDQFADISSGDELQTLIKPYANEEKLSYIKRRGEEERVVRTWLTNVVTTVQNAYVQEKAQTGYESKVVEGEPLGT